MCNSDVGNSAAETGQRRYEGDRPCEITLIGELVVCDECQASLDPADRFCPSCGASVLAAPATRVPTALGAPPTEPLSALHPSIDLGRAGAVDFGAAAAPTPHAAFKVGEWVAATIELPAAGFARFLPFGSQGVIIESGSSQEGVVHTVEFTVDGSSCVRTVQERLLRPAHLGHSEQPTAPAQLGFAGNSTPVVLTPVVPSSVDQATVDQATVDRAPVDRPPAVVQQPPRHTSPPMASPSARPSTTTPPVGQTLAADGFKGWSFLVPLILYRLFFSIRRPLIIQTSLPVDRLHQVFGEVLGGDRSLNMLLTVSNSYLRNVRWAVHRTTDHESVAECCPKGLVSFSAGKMKRMVDVTGDEVTLETTLQSSGKVLASIGATTYTIIWGMVAFPNVVLYPRAVVKRWKNEDPGLLIHHPWSRSRIVAWGIFLLFLLVSLTAH